MNSSRKFWRTRRVVMAGILVGLAVTQSAYLILTGGLGRSLSWTDSAMPVQLQVWQGFSDSLPWIVDGSRPKLALQEALSQWARSSTVDLSLIETGRSDAGRDGVNLLTIHNSSANRDVLQGQLAVTLVWSQQVGGTERVLESDIVFNPEESKPWSTVEQRDTLNLLDVATHEFGHMLGLEHSVSRSSRMFFQGGSYGFGFNQLSWDDVAGINNLYPLVGIERITGAITGRVTRNGQPVFGAFVVAADEHGALAANAITLRDGAFRMDRLPPGRYTLYAEPLDGPTTPYNLSGGLFNPPDDLVTNFQPAFYQGSMSPQVNVAVGNTTGGINISVLPGNPEVDPEFIGTTDNPGGAARLTTAPTSAHQGRSTNLVFAGTGVDQLPDVGSLALLGTPSTTGNVLVTRTYSSYTFKYFPLTVPAGTPEGDYTVFFQRSGELGLMSGGFQVFSPYRFLQAFGQFAHIPGVASSSTFLMNLNQESTSQGRMRTPGSNGANEGVSVASLPRGLDGDISFNLEPAGSLFVESSGNQSFRGSLRAESNQPVAGALLIETTYGTTGVGPSRPTYSFLAPIEYASSGSAANTGLAITNLDEREALVYLQLQNEDGRVVGQTVVNLAPNGHLARFVDELLPAALGSSHRGTLLATSNRKMAATAIRTSPGVFTTFPVIQSRVEQRSVFAQFAQVNSLSSELVLINPSTRNRARQVSVQIRSSDGQATGVTLNGIRYPTGRVTLDIEPLGMVRLKSSGSPVVGWAEVRSALPVGGVLLFSSPDFGTAGVGESILSPRQLLPIDRDLAAGEDMGIALVNTESRTVNVQLTTRDQTGAVVGQVRQIALAPNQHLARFPDDAGLELGLPSRFTGTLWIEADGDLGVTGIRQSPGVLTTFPPASLEFPLTPQQPE